MKRLNQIAPFFPWIGLILLIGGALAYFVTRRWDLLPNLLFAGGALFLLLFAMLRPDDVRRLMSGRQTRYGTSTLLSVVFFLAIVVLGYYLTYENTDWRYDATETSQFTPLDETVAILESLEAPIHVIGFYSFQLAFQEEATRAQLESLQAYTDQFTFEFVDPDENPLLAEKYELTFDGSLVFTRGEGENETFAKAAVPVDETSIHTALLKVINPVEKKIYFITGHGERDTEGFAEDGIGTAVRLLAEAGFDTDTLNLFTAGEIPTDATAIAIIDQQAPMTEAEVTAIRNYLASGGTAFIARDALESEGDLQTSDDALAAMLQADWGVTFRPDFIIEQVFAQAGQSFGLVFLGASYGASTITSGDLDQFGTVYDIARSIETEPLEGITRINLVMTSDQAWGETDFNGLANGMAVPDDGIDASGPLAIGSSLENTATGARLVVFGDTDFLSNVLLLQNGNSILMTNAFNWLADDELSVELTPRETVTRQLTISQTQLGLIQIVVLLLTPGIAAIIGFSVWFSRRQTR
ncbi:MAG: hypothetical protein DWQ04_09680 [Chloroflexi bacterium]|nr:MAG: hypothetical protein DWQ04_09680 [Chloroflexota bacterium]